MGQPQSARRRQRLHLHARPRPARAEIRRHERDEWLDFIGRCRAGFVHDYDIVEGPMADDTIWNYVNDFLSGNISRQAFWELARFKRPTHQISFHTIRALACLEFERSEPLHDR